MEGDLHVERSAEGPILMNLRQSDAELRLQMQQIDAAQSPRSRRLPNPFSAAFGIGVIVLLIWLIFSIAPIIGRLTSLAN